MFILYAVVLGIIIGYILGGRLKYLSQTTFKKLYLAIGGFLIQIFIFSDIPFFKTLQQNYESIVIALHILSYILILIFISINYKVPGIAVIGVGILLNAIVIILNRGHMPASIESFSASSIGKHADLLKQGESINNSKAITAETILPWLGDIFVIPSYIPLSNVFSIGDVIIAIGVCIYFAMNMKAAKSKVKSIND
ncbi:MAG TPA: DUF5317 domain-containing protein [Clostridiaceae bacterium]|nr:DUF5317 domain-containing protein [Clostridiaceae bacterium]